MSVASIRLTLNNLAIARNCMVRPPSFSIWKSAGIDKKSRPKECSKYRNRADSRSEEAGELSGNCQQSENVSPRRHEAQTLFTTEARSTRRKSKKIKG